MTHRITAGRFVLPALGLFGGLAIAGCTEELLTNFDSENAPGGQQPTIEVSLKAGDLPFWRDTTYTGFADASSVGYQLVVRDSGVVAHAVGRFSTLPDSVGVDTIQVKITGFENGRFRLVIDSLLSTLPEDSSGVLLSIYSLSRTYEEREANWLEARTGEMWTTPGGDVGELLGQGQLVSAADTVLLPILVSTDSLLSLWRETDGEPGVLVRIDDGEGRLRVQNFSVLADGLTNDLPNPVSIARGAQATTFLQDPPSPGVNSSLRMGGLPAARPYWKFQLPDSIGGVPLRGATINKAAFVFHPLPAPDYPFALGTSDTLSFSVLVTATAVALLANPFVDFEKTPVGGLLTTPPEVIPLRPDSLKAGVEILFDATLVLADWSINPEFDDQRLQFVIRPAPEGATLGYWEFGSVESAAALQPEVRIVFTPPADFHLP